MELVYLGSMMEKKKKKEIPINECNVLFLENCTLDRYLKNAIIIPMTDIDDSFKKFSNYCIRFCFHSFPDPGCKYLAKICVYFENIYDYF